MVVNHKVKQELNPVDEKNPVGSFGIQPEWCPLGSNHYCITGLIIEYNPVIIGRCTHCIGGNELSKDEYSNVRCVHDEVRQTH